MNEVCPRCAVITDYLTYESKTQARKAGAIGDTRNHTPEDCIAHLVTVINGILQR